MAATMNENGFGLMNSAASESVGRKTISNTVPKVAEVEAMLADHKRDGRHLRQLLRLAKSVEGKD